MRSRPRIRSCVRFECAARSGRARSECQSRLSSKAFEHTRERDDPSDRQDVRRDRGAGHRADRLVGPMVWTVPRTRAHLRSRSGHPVEDVSSDSSHIRFLVGSIRIRRYSLHSPRRDLDRGNTDSSALRSMRHAAAPVIRVSRLHRSRARAGSVPVLTPFVFPVRFGATRHDWASALDVGVSSHDARDRSAGSRGGMAFAVHCTHGQRAVGARVLPVVPDGRRSPSPRLL